MVKEVKMNKPKKIYIGIDPDMRKLNAAIITDQKKPLAVFLRRNKEGKDDVAVANAAYFACRLVEDVIAFIVAELDEFEKDCEIVTIIESQSMMHTKLMRAKGRKIDYEKVRRLSQVTGCLMGVFSNLSTSLYLVQPISWKGTVPKPVAHKRYYKHLGLEGEQHGSIKNLYPASEIVETLINWSIDNINPGDFMDINDSLGLALYGVSHGL